MTYIPFARKWRPQNFDEVVAQEHITRTLKNAIDEGRIADAYLFAGPRGTGKTSCARIFAKALNCEKGTTAYPCSRCDACRETAESRSLDVIEIDGASNRGVENVRDLRESVKFSPSKGRFKVYIIDEVHMLTPEAFNALLKTLEEPPAHVKFVFATTAPHKLPATILSRCQRFDFRRISSASLITKLKEIAKSEKIDADDAALLALARAADGSMRDAISVFEQIASFKKGRISPEDVTGLLGIVGIEALYELADKIIGRDTKSGIEIVNGLADAGKETQQILAGLIEHFRNLLVIKMGADQNKLIDLPAEYIKRLAGQAADVSVDEMMYIFSVLASAGEAMRRAPSAKIALEIAVIRLTNRASMKSIQEILKMLSPSGTSAQAQHPQQPKAVSAPALKSDSAVTLDELISRWNEITDEVAKKKMSAATYAKEARPVSLDNGLLTLGFAKEQVFYKEGLEKNGNKELFEQALLDKFGARLRLKFSLFAQPAQSSARKDNEAQKQDDEQPIIKSVLNIFGGKITKRYEKEA